MINIWTQTPISANIGTFVVALSMYVLIETRKKGYAATSQKTTQCYVYVLFFKKTVEDILLPQKASTIYFLVKIIQGFKCLKSSYFHEKIESFGTSI